MMTKATNSSIYISQFIDFAGCITEMKKIVLYPTPVTLSKSVLWCIKRKRRKKRKKERRERLILFKKKYIQEQN